MITNDRCHSRCSFKSCFVTKIKFLLGVQQKGRGLRRDVFFTTDTNEKAIEDEKNNTLRGSYSRKQSNSETDSKMKARNKKDDETPFSRKSDVVNLDVTVRCGKVEDCAICLSAPCVPKLLKCGHIFCEDCIVTMFKYKPVCPSCGSIQGVITGDQPPGQMKVSTYAKLHLPGYPDCGRIDIYYEIYPGIQGPGHPEPGKRFEGIRRTAYLPDNTIGRNIAKMFEVAFNRKLIFTIGRSRTTGKDGVVTWNDIHHKTIPHIDSQFGYPDPTYLDRVVEELSVKGVTEKDI